ncbi:MAG: glycosyltransferase [Tepidanaerobacteraceae bacterium]|jgi:glycosyltransferase involved in cell wall biosynthesis|nr:glycosyltransferase [Tepidanaerobacteraceae bacterium]
MNIAVVPAKNEQGRIGKALAMLGKSKIDRIIAVVNGSRDNTMREIKSLKMPNVEIIYFKPELGIDIPRAIGAYRAFKDGARSVVFVDGDMIGNIPDHIDKLISAVVDGGVDLAMADCYPENIRGNELAHQLLIFRKLLNVNLGIYRKVGVATPSHGPHAVSRKLLEKADFRDFAVPPVILAFAVKHALTVKTATSLPQNKMGSKSRGFYHAAMIAETIIGDSLEALNYFNGRPRKRIYLSREFQGYNPERRFDILERYLEKN